MEVGGDVSFGSLIESFAHGVCVFDLEYNLLYINPAAQRLVANDSLRSGQHHEAVFSFDFLHSRLKLRDIMDRTVQNRVRVSLGKNVLLKRVDGSTFRVEGYIEPLHNEDRLTGVMVVFTQNSHELLHDQLKFGFITVASHKLRTPLSGMKWMLEMLVNEEVGSLNDEQRDFLSQIQESNESMILLITNLLWVSRLESGKVEVTYSDVNLNSALEVLMHEFELEVKARNSSLTVTIDPDLQTIISDEKLLIVILKNLLSNAVEYSSPGGKNTITLSVFEERSDIIFSLRDTGIGISNDDKEKVFSIFYRSDDAMRIRTEGSGLGLFICKSIVELMDGSIWFESEYGKGSQFSFAIPKITHE